MTAFPEPGGPYEVDEAEYHADRTTLSSSGARTLAQSCPARYLYERDHGRPDTPTLEFGRAYHSMVLGSGAPVVEITAKTRGTKAEDAARAAGQIPLITKDYERAQAMAEQLRAHPIAGPLFARPGKAEQTFAARDEETGVMCRARVDWMPDVPADARLILVDLKTANDASPVGFAKSMANYGYHQQGAFYREVVAEALDLPISPRFVLVAQEKDPPYLITIAEPDDEALDWGRELNRHALRTYARCTAAGGWPGYEAALPADAGGIARLSLPGWQVTAYDRQFALIGDPA